MEILNGLFKRYRICYYFFNYDATNACVSMIYMVYVIIDIYKRHHMKYMVRLVQGQPKLRFMTNSI